MTSVSVATRGSVADMKAIARRACVHLMHLMDAGRPAQDNASLAGEAVIGAVSWRRVAGLPVESRGVTETLT